MGSPLKVRATISSSSASKAGSTVGRRWPTTLAGLPAEHPLGGWVPKHPEPGRVHHGQRHRGLRHHVLRLDLTG